MNLGERSSQPRHPASDNNNVNKHNNNSNNSNKMVFWGANPLAIPSARGTPEGIKREPSHAQTLRSEMLELLSEREQGCIRWGF